MFERAVCPEVIEMNVESVLDGILEKFRTGDIPEAVAFSDT